MLAFYRRIDLQGDDEPFRDIEIGEFYYHDDDYGRVTYLTFEMSELEDGAPFEDFTNSLHELPSNHENERFIPSDFSWDTKDRTVGVSDFREDSEAVSEPPPLDQSLARNPADRKAQLHDILLHAAARRGAQELAIRYQRGEPILLIDRHGNAVLGDDSSIFANRRVGYPRVSPHFSY